MTDDLRARILADLREPTGDEDRTAAGIAERLDVDEDAVLEELTALEAEPLVVRYAISSGRAPGEDSWKLVEGA